MPDTKIDSAVRSDKAVFVDFSVGSERTDAGNNWIDEKFYDYLGYYKDEKTPEITAIIDAMASWTVGKGFKADEETTIILDSIKGNGFDTFNSILENAMRVMQIGVTSMQKL